MQLFSRKQSLSILPKGVKSEAAAHVALGALGRALTERLSI